ncbi:MAG: UDP-glucose 4-epimerase GalE [Oscillospiraceae bacterium]|jgi:UDP-glucose 4-epimerase|nr:UDP-glucose 4-epimerase GalE [Oscillospiraceae bacterium]
MSILITGGAGFIGSHTCIELLNSGREIVVVDNFFNSKPKALEIIRELTGSDFKFYEADICDKQALTRVFAENEITEVIHFAGYKAVAESVRFPLNYYNNNVGGTSVLLEIMSRHNCKKLVFSSSATVYGIPESVPVNEDFPLSAINPYGRTKLIIEEMCRDLHISDNEWSIALLRYFNPVGAHESGKLGEDPNGIPNNLMPIILQAATGKIPEINVCGNDYPTPDGTCVRDYIHVVDLARGHIAALEHMKNGVQTYNLGAGKGYSVLDVINTFKRVNGVNVPYKIAERRLGDAAECRSDPSKAERELGWKAEFGIERMCEDAWRFTLLL